MQESFEGGHGEVEVDKPSAKWTNRLSSFAKQRVWTLSLVVISAILLAFLSRNHAFIPMWVEGIAEYQHVLLIMLGFIKANPDCWINFYNIHIPLAFKDYIGSAFFYFHLPTAYLWFNGYTSDPYIYRYPGILIFLVDGWILFYALRIYYKVSISFYGAAAFLTAGFVGCLTEAGSYYLMLFFPFVAIFFLSRYIKTGSVGCLLASALTYGMTLTTRIEFFVWSIIPFLIYLVVARPPVLLDRWRQTRRKVAVALGVLSLLCLGAAPMIVYNIICRSGGLLYFFNTTVLPGSFGAATMPLAVKLQTRLEQFWYGNLLGTEGPHTGPANYIFGVLWLLCAGALIVRWITQRKASVFLIIILTSIPLSLFVTHQIRSGHLAAIQPAVLMVIVSGLAYLNEFPRFKKLTHVAFVLLIVGDVSESAMVWRSWNNQPDTAQTMLNQSDPVILANYLTQHHSNDRILYTNIGMAQYMSYMTVARLNGEEILAWGNDEGFANNVRIALLDSTHRRVFVAVAKERDGGPGTMARTGHLYSLLNQYAIPHTVVPLSNERNRFLYEVVTVEKGAALKREDMNAQTLRVSGVVDVRLVPQPTGGSLVVGSIHGAGFKLGDVILINGKSSFQTAFGHEGWITFAIPIDAIEDGDSFILEVLHPGTLERSLPQNVRSPR